MGAAASFGERTGSPTGQSMSSVGHSGWREVLSRYGLRPGDVLVAIDNLPLDAGRMAGLGDELAVLDKVEIAYERNGVVEDRPVKFRPR